MPTTKIAVTGGIGCGKSFVCHSIEAAGYPIFYCDNEAKRIIRTDKVTQKALKALVCKEVYTKDNQLNKAVLRDFICKSKSNAKKVDAIVHPRVGEAFLEWSQSQNSEKVFMECALLFESGFDRYVDYSIFVSAPVEVRISRVMKRDGVSRTQALEWMKLQMPEEEKRQRANYTIINDGDKDIAEQLQQILNL